MISFHRSWCNFLTQETISLGQRILQIVSLLPLEKSAKKCFNLNSIETILSRGCQKNLRQDARLINRIWRRHLRSDEILWTLPSVRSFFPQSKNMHARQIGIFKLFVHLWCKSVCLCMWPCYTLATCPEFNPALIKSVASKIRFCQSASVNWLTFLKVQKRNHSFICLHVNIVVTVFSTCCIILTLNAEAWPVPLAGDALARCYV